LLVQTQCTFIYVALLLIDYDIIIVFSFFLPRVSFVSSHLTELSMRVLHLIPRLGRCIFIRKITKSSSTK